MDRSNKQIEIFASRCFGHSQSRGQIGYRGAERLFDPFGEDELHLGAHIVGEFAEVLLILFGQDGAADAGAARTFSLTPPIGRAYPVNVTSPVIAVSLRAGVLV